MRAPRHRRSRRRSVVRACAAAAAVLGPPSAAAAPDFAPCRIGSESATVRAECATLAVALDPDAPDAGTIDLAIARVRARGRDPAADPFVFVAGGPGQSAREVWGGVAGAFADVARERDVILVDQRGTGGSSPLDCPEQETGDGTGGGTGVGTPAATPAAPEAEAAASRVCLAALEADPRLFTTSVAVADLERVRAALGVERWNLYGVSYGTRVAMHYARRHPARVRAMILDAAVPPGTPLGADIARHAQRALDDTFARCAAEPGCAAAFPDIAARARALIASLAEAPRTVEFEDLASGRVRTEPFEREALAATLRLLGYSAWGASLVPSMLDDAIRHDHFAPLARQAAIQAEALEATLATGMHRAIVCTEDLPFVDVDATARAAEGTYLGPEPIRALAAACAPWPRGRLDADFHDPLELDVPTLVLSGGADPVTPPEFGERAIAGLARARHLVNPGQGHMQAQLGCVPRLMARFVEAPDPEALATGCLERLAPPPFFVDANGPLP